MHKLNHKIVTKYCVNSVKDLSAVNTTKFRTIMFLGLLSDACLLRFVYMRVK